MLDNKEEAITFTNGEVSEDTAKFMNDLAARYNEGKPQWSLVDFESLVPMVRVLEYGADKYDAHNWKKGFPYTKLMESMLRHCFAYLEGEDKDPESGLDHVGHILCNAMFLAYNHKHHPQFDDRYTKE